MSENTPEAEARGSSLSRADAAELSRQVANLASSGLPLPSGLRALAEEVPSSRLQRVLIQVADDLQAGESLEEALRSQGPRFPAPLRGLITAGTRSGRLADSLGRFLDVHDFGDSLRRQFRFSLIYPALLMMIGSAMFGFVAVTTAHSFQNIFQDFGVEVPWITMQLLTASQALVRIGWWIVIWPILAIFALWASTRFFLGEAERSRLLHSLPLVGPLARTTAIAEFCPILALLLESDVPLPEALSLSADSARDPRMAESAREMAEEVAAGCSLGESMKDRRPFPPGFDAFVVWAERHRGLIEALRMSAETFETKARAQAAFVARFCNVLAVVVVLWWMGITVIALVGPLMDLIDQLSGLGPPRPWVGYALFKVGGIVLGTGSIAILMIFLFYHYLDVLKKLGRYFLFGLFLVMLSVVGFLATVAVDSVLGDFMPAWWKEAVWPYENLMFSFLGGVGLLLMVFEAFRSYSGTREGKSGRVRVHRVRGLQMSLRHLMFGMVPLALFFVLVKNFGWSLLTVPAMLSPPLLIVSLIVAITNRKTSQRDALLGVMAMAARENQPLDPAISAFAEGCRGRYRSRLKDLARALNAGAPLPEALQRSPGALSAEGEVIVSVGCETNTLARSLDDAVTAISARRIAQSATAGLVGYPLLVFTVLIAVFVYLSVRVTRHFEMIFRDYNLRLPEPTRSIFAAMRDFANLDPVVILLAACLGLAALGVVAAGLKWSGMIASMRDRVLRRRHTSIVLRALAAAVESEQTLRTVLERLGRSYPRRWIRVKLARVQERVERGESVWRAFLAEGLINQGDAGVLDSASGAGNLPWALREMADSGERRLTYHLQAIGQVLQPAVIVALGAMALLIALTYFRPLIQLIQSLSGPEL